MESNKKYTIAYAQNCSNAGRPVSIFQLDQDWIDISACKTHADFESAIDGHDDYVVVETNNASV